MVWNLSFAKTSCSVPVTANFPDEQVVPANLEDALCYGNKYQA